MPSYPNAEIKLTTVQIDKYNHLQALTDQVRMDRSFRILASSLFNNIGKRMKLASP